ncbi:MAG TPA: hypothetical protein VII58_00870 [Acidobacteriaceae bacterium]
MKSETKSGTVRSVRRVRHPGWFYIDNEVIDFFGEDLGPYGITLYGVLSRECRDNYLVDKSLEKLAPLCFMSKTELQRRLKDMVALGLVRQVKGRTATSRSVWELMDVKELKQEMLALAKDRAASQQSGPHRTRISEGSATGPQDAGAGLPLTNHRESSSDAATGTQADLDSDEELELADLPPGRGTNWSPQDQMGADVEKLESSPPSGPDLVPKRPLIGPDLVQSASRVIHREDLKTKDLKTGVAALPEGPEPGDSGQRPSPQVLEPARHAERLMYLLGIVVSRNDLDLVRQVIEFEARRAHAEPEETCRYLLQAAQQAMKRGEKVNVFWFKDRKFTNGGNDGEPRKSGRSPAKERIDSSRRALAEIAVERGLIDAARFNGGDDAPVPDPGPGGEHS